MTTNGGAGPHVSRVKSVCRMCHGGCGAVIELVDGSPTRIHGDPENPTSEGYFCVKGKASLDLLHSPDRLRTPLVRTGRRGTGEFEPVGWDRALGRIADELTANMARYGPESVVLGQGTDRNYQEWVFRLANALGTPNVVGPAHVCFYPRVMASILTYGGFTFCDYEGDPEVVLLWGSNKPNTHSDGVIGIKLLRAVERGSKVVAIDPRKTQTAARADLHLPLRPGTDCALALGMIKIVIDEGWYDRQFVADHTSGFDELAEHVRRFDPERVGEITGLAPDLVLEATRLYATASRACVEAGTGLSQNRNSFDTHRSIALLSAICGNLDAPGGDLMWDPMPVDGRRSFPRSDLLSAEQEKKRIGGDVHKVLSMTGWVAPGDLQRAILTESPYRVSSLVLFGSNILASHEDTGSLREAIAKLDLLVVCDMFLTPTARLADVILPVSSWLERDQIVEFNSYIAARQKVYSLDGCRSDEEIILDLAERLGLGHHFFPSLEAALDAKLAGMGITWEQFKKTGYIPNEKRYHKYRESGFRTRSGRVNLVNNALISMGYKGLPEFKALPEPTRDLPYIMTSAHARQFYNSEFHQLPTTARTQSAPHLTMSPRAAEREELSDGDMVEVFARPGGRVVRMKVRISTGLDTNVVMADACWWYPGELSVDESLTSSVNLITGGNPTDEHMGSAMLRGIPVGIRRARAAGRTTRVDHG
ncbi:molybdopterin oxidoreductase [Streptomyces yokosukanensis]|uniref:Molybdopterin oxidoreductase n=1 Tax=Streptomyces yokosukanensis TaxID=67386 RepID=A0A101P4G8_9ACTN|nr:molybdopterin-dependent oxidoreductase [Streptomyces yokosukanensis]KUN04773.1 molybdopterin oxidoreductase [Streptomyces yokosukanensis]